jgi:hypothetical protein
VAGAAKIMERMVNQNTFDDIAQGVLMISDKVLATYSVAQY